MKKSTTRISIILMVVVVGVVGYYAYLAGRHTDAVNEAVMTTTQLVLSRDLENDYPPTVKEVIKYYIEIQKCFYNEECTDDEVEQLGMQARALYDAELLEKNEVGTYLINLQKEIAEFKEKKRTMTSAAVASSANVDFFTADGYDFARIHCGYNVMESGVSNAVKMVYLLRRDEDRKWKIYGWDLAENVN